MNTNVLKTSNNYTNKVVSVTNSNNSKIFLRLLWFILLKDSPTTVLYLPWHQHQSGNQVLKNHCVCLLTFLCEKKLLIVELELINLSARQLNFKINHGHWNKSEKGNSKIYEQIKMSLYNWIMHHPQVVQSPIVNDCMKVKMDGHT